VSRQPQSRRERAENDEEDRSEREAGSILRGRCDGLS
jgi:hypothetical protein